MTRPASTVDPRDDPTDGGQPLVSVVLPVRNGEPYLAAAMESILRQTHGRLELIVIDDGSTDSSARIAEGFADPRVAVVRNGENLGLVATLNKGLALAQGELVARMDADDVADPRRVEAQVSRFLHDSRLVALGTGMRYIDAAGNESGSPRRLALRPAVVRWRLLRGTCLFHPTLMLHRARAGADARYSPEFVHAEDYELLLRLSRHHDLDNLPEPLLSQRLHGQSVSSRFREQQLQSAASALISHVHDRYGVDMGPGDARVLLEPRCFFDAAAGEARSPVASVLALERRFLASERSIAPADTRDVRRDVAFFLWKLAVIATTEWGQGAFPGRRVGLLAACAWALLSRPRAALAALAWR